MDTDIVDKIIIVLLVTLLPISVLLASNYQQRMETKQKVDIEKEQMVKVTEAVNQMRQQDMAAKKEIEIIHVYYATDSSKLVVKGKAPKPDTSVMISSVLTPVNLDTDKVASRSSTVQVTPNVLGQAVEVVAVLSDKEGSFTFVKKIDPKEVSVADLRLDQDQVSATVRFDITKGIQL